MEAIVEKVFTEEIIMKGKQLFSVGGEWKKLGDFESFIFSGNLETTGTACILRFTHSSHRSSKDVFAEVEWVAYLKEKGARVPQHYYSIHHNLTEEIQAEDGSYFIVACYEMFEGSRIKWTEIEEEGNWEIVEEWGRTIGQLHRITKDYSPKDALKRLSWRDEELLQIEAWMENPDPEIVQYRDQILRQLEALPVNRNVFGLIHSDVHTGNFLVKDGKINVFDFDDCSYHWFASDIAIALYYSILSRDFQKSEEREEIAKMFLSHFLIGYETENHLPDSALQTIPIFLQLRDIVLYAVLQKKWDLSSLDDHQTTFFNMIESRVQSQQPIVQVTF
ncbi:Ser/Thr protein kinase RdoA (MazF antagonist) [Bacillus oleivorans]|uniref:Ser/Thr protein kinase RdoA (MazF antagonist) n=1 Tax=Bacillus oleivorans TaxID=1448271 RepID=A0A285D5F8_9BACI|nr:phosphotransferase [Bacillus oleivorans]SNX75009.1 Ser/Thr protein kinase RdoA (MazF antagonist) [Bacillus oleivorans]